MLIQLRDGTWIDPDTVTIISSCENGNKVMGGHLVNVYMREDRQYNIWFPPNQDAQVIAEAYRDSLAVVINDQRRGHKEPLPKGPIPIVWPEKN